MGFSHANAERADRERGDRRTSGDVKAGGAAKASLGARGLSHASAARAGLERGDRRTLRDAKAGGCTGGVSGRMGFSHRSRDGRARAQTRALGQTTGRRSERCVHAPVLPKRHPRANRDVTRCPLPRQASPGRTAPPRMAHRSGRVHRCISRRLSTTQSRPEPVAAVIERVSDP